MRGTGGDGEVVSALVSVFWIPLGEIAAIEGSKLLVSVGRFER